MEHEEGQIDLVTLPIFTLGNLASGMTSVLADMDFRRPGEPDAARLARQCALSNPHRCAASPAFFESLLNTAPEVLSRFTRIDTGGAPVFPELLERLRAVCDDKAHVAVVYGSTEAEPISHFEASQLTHSVRQRIREGGGLPVGRPVKEIQLAIMADHTRVNVGPLDQDAFERLRKGPMEKGEIVVTGAHVVQGYLDGRGDAEGKIRVGDSIWHRTGDAGYLDQEGNLWLLGRCAAADRRGAEVMYPFAVEAALRSISGRRCAFIARGDKRYVCVEGRIEAEEKSATMQALAWAEIDRIIDLETMPMDVRHQAKIDYPRLREQLNGYLGKEA